MAESLNLDWLLSWDTSLDSGSLDLGRANERNLIDQLLQDINCGKSAAHLKEEYGGMIPEVAQFTQNQNSMAARVKNRKLIEQRYVHTSLADLLQEVYLGTSVVSLKEKYGKNFEMVNALSKNHSWKARVENANKLIGEYLLHRLVNEASHPAKIARSTIENNPELAKEVAAVYAVQQGVFSNLLRTRNKERFKGYEGFIGKIEHTYHTLGQYIGAHPTLSLERMRQRPVIVHLEDVYGSQRSPLAVRQQVGRDDCSAFLPPPPRQGITYHGASTYQQRGVNQKPSHSGEKSSYFRRIGAAVVGGIALVLAVTGLNAAEPSFSTASPEECARRGGYERSLADDLLMKKLDSTLPLSVAKNIKYCVAPNILYTPR